MKPITPFLVAGIAAALAATLSPSFLRFDTSDPTTPATELAPVSLATPPAGYRDWKLVSVAREEGKLDDIRAILGNEIAIKAYRDNQPLPDGAILARLAWSYDASEENNQAFGARQSFVAGEPKNGVQFMIKDSKKYAATGGWAFTQFDNGKPAPPEALTSCFACHDTPRARDLVFTRYAR